MKQYKRLPQQLSDLLQEILLRRCPNLVGIIDSKEIPSLDRRHWEIIRDEVGNELLYTGIEKGELNSRGLLLDELIGYIVMNEPGDDQPC